MRIAFRLLLAHFIIPLPLSAIAEAGINHITVN